MNKDKPPFEIVGVDDVAEDIKPDASAERERNIVFSSLVKEDGDITGLVAYSIYKQNKLDWLQAFSASRGRVPDDAEVTAYIIGESTPRRLSIYRHLADATLAGNGPENALGYAAADAYALVRQGKLKDEKPRGLGWMATSLLSYGLLVVVILIGVWLVIRYGQPFQRP